MKRIKRVASILLAGMLAMSAVGMTAFADDSSYVITPDSEISSHTFEAYQIITGTITNDDEGFKFSDVDWGTAITESNFSTLITSLNANKDALGITEDLPADLTVEDFTRKVAAFSSEQTQTFARILDSVVKDAEHLTIETTEESRSIDVSEGGYYLIKDVTAGDDTVHNISLMLVVRPGDNSIIQKVPYPTLEHEIWHNDNYSGWYNYSEWTTENEWQEIGDYQIGEPGLFRITITNSYIEDYENYAYTIHINASDGLEINPDSIKVYYDAEKSSELPENAYTTETTETDDCDTHVTITLRKENQYLGEGKIYLFYEATLTEAAASDTSTAQTSTAYLEYPDPTTGEKGNTESITVYDYNLNLYIQKEDKKGNVKDAVFALTKDVTLKKEDFMNMETGELTDTDSLIPLVVENEDDVNKEYIYHLADEYTKDEDKVYLLKAGTTIIKGLDDSDGTIHETNDSNKYALVEVYAPEGYDALEDAVPVALHVGYDKDNHEMDYYGVILSVEDSDDYKMNFLDTNDDDAMMIRRLTIINAPDIHVTLPQTGGMGTKIFYVLGSILVLGSAVLLIVKKRMKDEN